ncbi:hypothetical protein GCM10011583_11650 [Streptomyces camponoticapitis]|uniref:Uncharacterized protein n=1 Tax=Streptomyces camponoticapitis TaxID=1616125 RepID=A0ABQ2E207_9ACTN|nr:hypothetical protein [Streptomyces camponoticapitis]GGJ81856.1 hypothetical protein GCM10011583_11650 [Streptomyces camponoticapitis]
MSKKNTGRRISGDPRKTGGDIVGPGGPRDRHGVILDDRNAVLLDHSTVTLVETANGQPVLAALLEGRINKTTERARTLYLMNEDGAAALVSELLALAHRIGPEFGERFTARVQKLVDDGAFGS